MPNSRAPSDLPLFGEPAPWFSAPCGPIHDFAFDSVAGRWVVLMFVGSLQLAEAQAAVQCIEAAGGLFDDRQAAFFGVTVDPRDLVDQSATGVAPGLRYFRDLDRAVSRAYGIAGTGDAYRPTVFLLDPLLRVTAYAPLSGTAGLLDTLRAKLPLTDEMETRHAPVLTVPRIFEADFCRTLIAHYDMVGGTPSGVMRQTGDRTVLVQDQTFKRRTDVEVAEETLKAAIRARIGARLVPIIERAFGWRATRLERYLVACYDAGSSGFFRAHRDNTTLGTAHRRLAVTINLNTGEYEGGELRFPEFGATLFKPPVGSAVVFGCGLLHEVLPVTCGRRYACLPFLYDEEAARVRDGNSSSLL